MAFLLGLIGTVILVVLIGAIGFAIFIGMAVYYMLFAAAIALFIATKLIIEGFAEDNYGMGLGGIALLLIVVGLVVRLYRGGNKDVSDGAA